MKKTIIMLVVMLLLSVPALADTYVYSSDQAPAVYFECEDFDGKMPDALAVVFDSCLHEDNEILCGTLRVTKYHSGRETENGTDALLAIRRDGKTVLLGASKTDGAWQCTVETDSFFAPGQRFDVTVLPFHNLEGGFIGTYPALVCGEEEFLLDVGPDGKVMLQQYQRPWEDGSTLHIRVYMSSMYASRHKDGILQESRSATGVFSSRLCGWTYETFPKSCAEVEAWRWKDMPEFEEGEAFIFGVNLRERPTGKSPSMGQYTARVRVLDRAEGPQAPWYQVQVDDKIGWVSGTYVLWPQNEQHLSEIALYLSQMLYP